MRGIPWWKHMISLQPSSSTCLNTLPWTNQKVWCTKRAMLVHYRIKAHWRCQTTLLVFKSLQCTLSNDPDGPMAWATEGVCGWLSSTWHVKGFHLDSLILIVPNIPCDVRKLLRWLGIPELPALISRFLQSTRNYQLGMDEEFTGKVYLYSSAVATYFAPSDMSGIGGMLHERIHSMYSRLFTLISS